MDVSSDRYATDCVYVIQADNGDVKIGISGTPYARLSKIKTEYGGRRKFNDAYLVGFAITRFGMAVEMYSQRHFEEFAVGGEWFQVNSLLALGVVSEVARLFDPEAVVHTVGPEEPKPSKKVFRDFVRSHVPDFEA